jgi:DNA (cytosine-5)-methyltransferase 1
MPESPVFIDLFCGCGGFTLGLERAGFKGLAALDNNHEALQIFRANFRDVPHILEEDVLAYSPVELEKLIGTRGLDLAIRA